MAILELSTSVPLNEGHFTYKGKRNNNLNIY